MTSTSTPDRPLRADAVRNRARVLVAAREVFAARGLDVTLDDIAHHAGLGTGTVYRRFADREAIVEAVFAQRVGEVAQRARACLADPDPWQGFVTLLRSACEELASDRGLRQVMTASFYGQEAVARQREQVLDLVTQVVRRAQGAGVLRPDFRPEDIPLVFLVIGAVVDFAGDQSPDLWVRYFTFLLDGLGSAHPPHPAGKGQSVELPDALGHDELSAAMATWRPPSRPATRVPGHADHA